jgi:hypothetical protein
VGSVRRKPGVRTHLLGGLIVILPKLGMLKMLAIKDPTVETERAYIASVNLSTATLAVYLRQLMGTKMNTGLTDRDLDTGQPGGSWRVSAHGQDVCPAACQAHESSHAARSGRTEAGHHRLLRRSCGSYFNQERAERVGGRSGETAGAHWHENNFGITSYAVSDPGLEQELPYALP